MTLQRALDQSAGIGNQSDIHRRAMPSGEGAPEHLKLGCKGEDIAVSYLETLGYRIIARNVNFRCGEIDIIAKDKDEIVFAEVRTRTGTVVMPASETVGPDKIRKLTRAAMLWTDKNRYCGFCRIDLVAITIKEGCTPEIEHIKDITGGIT